LYRHEESEAIEAGLGVMQVAYKGKAHLVPGLAEALLKNLTAAPPVAMASAWALGWLNKKVWRAAPADIHQLLRIVSDANSSPRVVRFLGWILKEQGAILGDQDTNDAVAPLIARLDHCDPDVRRVVVQTLGQIKSEAAVAPLIARLDDSDQEVRSEAAQALGRIKSKEAVAPLIARLDDGDQNVRTEAANALGRIKSKAAVAPLTARLNDSDPYVRKVVVQALGEIRGEAAVAAVIARLGDGDADVRRAALEAGSKRLHTVDRKLLTHDLDGLRPFLDPHDDIRNQAAAAAASKLSLTIEEVRERYEVLAGQFHLNLEWRPALPRHS
jgi:HEAT repeat protein